jgi:guanosine-3',5'-bis(diphosphate) 3'-pyrophosphohydrolase
MPVQPHSFLWQRAAGLAARSHRHQLRKDNITPYVCHPFRVALTVSQVFGEQDETMLAAALLHDVIEDTTCDYDDVEAACGGEVAALVAALSKDKRMREDRREEAYARQIAASDWRARMIKLADVYDNLCDGVEAGCAAKVWGRAMAAISAARGEPRLARAVRAVESLVEALREKRAGP